MIKLLAIDLDDTCLNWKNKITLSTLCSLKKAAEKNVEIVFVTGRSYESLPYQLKKETFFRYVISSNGACVVDRKTQDVIYQSYIPSATAVSLLKRAREQKFGITVHMDKKHMVEGKHLLLLGKLLYGRDSRKIINVKDMLEQIAKNGNKIEEIHLFFFKEKKRQRARMLRKEYRFLNAPMDNFCVEFVTAETTKGNALEWLYRKLGFAQSEIACIGNGENDISMFEKSGLRFAVDNAQINLKAIAHFVVPCNNEDGVCVAVERILNCELGMTKDLA